MTSKLPTDPLDDASTGVVRRSRGAFLKTVPERKRDRRDPRKPSEYAGPERRKNPQEPLDAEPEGPPGASSASPDGSSSRRASISPLSLSRCSGPSRTDPAGRPGAQPFSLETALRVRRADVRPREENMRTPGPSSRRSFCWRPPFRSQRRTPTRRRPPHGRPSSVFGSSRGRGKGRAPRGGRKRSASGRSPADRPWSKAPSTPIPAKRC
jgi:hypothetical protein